MDKTFSDAEEPAIRRGELQGEGGYEYLRDFPCPFCGNQSLLKSHHDVSQDRLRIQLYCNNPWCDVREFDVIAMRAGGLEVGRRDIEALHSIDAGPAPDQLQSPSELAASVIGLHNQIYRYRTTSEDEN